MPTIVKKLLNGIQCKSKYFAVFLMYRFCIFCAFYYADTVGLVTISCEYFDKMLNDVLDKIIYWLMMKNSFWHDLNPCLNLESMVLPTTTF